MVFKNVLCSFKKKNYYIKQLAFFVIFLFILVLLNGQEKAPLKEVEEPNQTGGKNGCTLEVVTKFLPHTKSYYNGEEIIVKTEKEVIFRLIFVDYDKIEKCYVYKIYMPRLQDCQIRLKHRKWQAIMGCNLVDSDKYIEFLPIKEHHKRRVYQFLCELSAEKEFSISMYVEKSSHKNYKIEKIEAEEPYILLRRKVSPKELFSHQNLKVWPSGIDKSHQHVDTEDIFLAVYIPCEEGKRGDFGIGAELYYFKIYLPVGGLSKVIYR